MRRAHVQSWLPASCDGRRLLPAFNTTLGLATQSWNVHDQDRKAARGSVPTTCLAEIGTLSMEFTAVSQLTGGWVGMFCGVWDG